MKKQLYDVQRERERLDSLLGAEDPRSRCFGRLMASDVPAVLQAFFDAEHARRVDHGAVLPAVSRLLAGASASVVAGMPKSAREQLIDDMVEDFRHDIQRIATALELALERRADDPS